MRQFCLPINKKYLPFYPPAFGIVRCGNCIVFMLHHIRSVDHYNGRLYYFYYTGERVKSLYA